MIERNKANHINAQCQPSALRVRRMPHSLLALVEGPRARLAILVSALRSGTDQNLFTISSKGAVCIPYNPSPGSHELLQVLVWIQRAWSILPCGGLT